MLSIWLNPFFLFLHSATPLIPSSPASSPHHCRRSPCQEQQQHLMVETSPSPHPLGSPSESGWGFSEPVLCMIFLEIKDVKRQRGSCCSWPQSHWWKRPRSSVQWCQCIWWLRCPCACVGQSWLGAGQCLHMWHNFTTTLWWTVFNGGSFQGKFKVKTCFWSFLSLIEEERVRHLRDMN